MLDNDITSIGVNDEQEYLSKAHMKAKKLQGKETGKRVPSNYGSRKDLNEEVYSDRGLETPDEKKLVKQAMPNNRMYNYCE